MNTHSSLGAHDIYRQLDCFDPPLTEAPSTVIAPRVFTDPPFRIERRKEGYDAAKGIRQADVLTFEQIRSCVLDRDEASVCALLDDSTQNRIIEKVFREHPELRLQLYHRAERTAAEEGVAWMPLLDSLADSGWWPLGDGRIETSTGLVHVTPVPPERFLEGLRSWVAKQSHTAPLHRLLAFRSSGVAVEVARGATCWDAVLVRRLLQVPDAFPVLVRNPMLNQEAAEAIHDWVVQRIATLHDVRSPVLAMLLDGLLALHRRGLGLAPPRLDLLIASIGREGVRKHRAALRTLSQFHLPFSIDRARRPAFRY